MLFKPVAILVLIFSRASHGKSTSRTNLISKSVDFIDSLTMPTKITAYTCWSKKIENTFWQNLAKRYHVSFSTKMNLQPGLHNQLYIMDLACNGSLAVLKQAEELKLLKTPTKWLLFGRTEDVSDIYFGADSEIFIMDPEYNIATVYKYSSTHTDFVKDYITHYHNLSTVKRTNLMGSNISISIVITNPDSLNHLWDYRDSHVDAISKLNYVLVNNLMDYLNASRQFIVRPTWGYKNVTTGLYSGMAGDLQTGLADLGGTPLFFTSDRVDIIDYISATTPTYMKFIFRAPPLSYVTNVFTLPFDSSVWHYCFIMVAVVVIFVYVIVAWEWKEAKFRNKILRKHTDVLRPNFFDVIMMEIGAITQQGSDVEPQSNAGRIITIFMFTTLMFLYTSYSANIVALLQSTTDRIQTLEDLLNSRIKIGVEDIVYAHYYFERAEEPVRKAIYQQKVAPKGQKSNFMKARDGISRVQQGFFAFHVELNTGYKIISDIFQEGEKCTLKEIAFENFIEPYLAAQKNSAYKEIMKIGLRKMHESGVQSREVRKIYTRKPQCHAGGSNFGSVGMIDCYSAFLIFATGISSAALLLILELILKKYLETKASSDNIVRSELVSGHA